MDRRLREPNPLLKVARDQETSGLRDSLHPVGFYQRRIAENNSLIHPIRNGHDWNESSNAMVISRCGGRIDRCRIAILNRERRRRICLLASAIGNGREMIRLGAVASCFPHFVIVSCGVPCALRSMSQ